MQALRLDLTRAMRSDAELLDAWRAGDLDAGDRLFSRYFDRVFRFFSAKLGSHVEDLTQRTFEACVRAAPRISDGTSFRGYLFGIARRQLLQHLERQRYAARVIPQEHSLRDLGTSPSEAIAAAEAQRIVLEALRGLPLDHQIALELFYWEGMSVGELATVLGVPAGTVKSRLSRARENLREEIRAMPMPEVQRADTLRRLDVFAKELGDALRRGAGET